MSTVPADLHRILKRQHNAVTAAQLAACAMPRGRTAWLLKAGQWQRVGSGLYYAGRGEQPWISRAWGASAVTGPDGVLGGTTAARLHDLIATTPNEVTVYVPPSHKPVRRPGIRTVRSRLVRRTQTVDGLRCTTVPETILDCADELSGHELEALIGRAFQRQKASKSVLKQAMNRRRAVAHRDLLIAAACDAATGAHSYLEIRYLRRVERRHGILVPDRNVRVGPDGFWVDIYYPEQDLIIELDGRAFHEGAEFRDRLRDNRNARPGRTTMRFGYADVMERSCAVARDTVTMLVRLGWSASTVRSCGPGCLL